MTAQGEQIPLAGVIGQPIHHSKSPALHAHWLGRYGIRGHYIPMPVAAEDLSDVLRALPRMGFRGVNITIPHKEVAVTLADSVSDRAALIGAANTLTFRADGSIHADNTDGYGFIANLKQNASGWRAAAGPAIVLGAGGAARAVISALLNEGVPRIVLTNRTRARSDMLKDHFGGRIKVVDRTRVAEFMEEAATLVNTTSLGMTGKPELSVDISGLPTTALVTDIVYTPLRTGLLERAQAHGCQTVDGLGMLIHQAVPGFETWFGQRPEVDDAVRSVVLNA